MNVSSTPGYPQVIDIWAAQPDLDRFSGQAGYSSFVPRQIWDVTPLKLPHPVSFAGGVLISMLVCWRAEQPDLSEPHSPSSYRCAYLGMPGSTTALRRWPCLRWRAIVAQTRQERACRAVPETPLKNPSCDILSGIVVICYKYIRLYTGRQLG